MSEAGVSVIIPAYNSGNSLKLAVNSALEQECKPLEVIVVNDGSTDNTGEVAKSYGERIRYIEQQNQGQGAARNAGLAVARGTFIAFLDADDYWLREFLSQCVDYLEANPNVVAVSTGIIVRMLDGEEIIGPSCLLEKQMPVEPFVIDNFFEFWATQDHVRTGSNVIRKSVIDIAGPQRADLRISQDLEYWAYIATFGQWGFIAVPLWVGNSRAAVAPQGWLASYRQRRRLCPTVESWEQRIVPRLKPHEKHWFAIVRGRVAINFAQSKILAGNSYEALQIYRKYRTSMPKSSMASVMQWGALFGRFSWFFASAVIRVKELIKAWSLSMRAVRDR